MCSNIHINILYKFYTNFNSHFTDNYPYLCAMASTEILLAIGLLGLAVAGIAIKILVKPGGEFSGTCSSNNPLLRNEEGACTVCGARPQDACQAENP